MIITVIYFAVLLCIFLRMISFAVYCFKNSGVSAGVGAGVIAAGVAATGILSVMSI